MSGVATARAVAGPRGPAPVVQRRCACGAKREDECRECKAKRVQRLPVSTAAAHATSVPPIVNAVLQSTGSPLDAPTRKWFETRFARDFSNVRIHTDERAAASARVLNAFAYTSGANIVFGAGQYSTQSERGRRLLAHELTHVVQQRARLVPGGVTSPDDSAEREAERNADRLGSAGTFNFEARPHLVSRQAATATPSSTPGTCTPEQKQAIEPARTTSRDWLRTAVRAVGAYISNPASRATAATRTSLVKHFHAPDVGIATDVHTNLQSILRDIEEVIEFERPSEDFRRFPGHITECRGNDDPRCDGAGAFVEASRIVFCPSFFDSSSDRYRAGTLIHEVAHSLVGLHIVDRAYQRDRLLEFLSPAEALNNAESYAMFAEELGTGQAVEGTAPREEPEDCAPDVKRGIREALGRAERWNGVAERVAKNTRAESIRFNTPIFTTHLGNAEPPTRAAAVRLFRRTSSDFASAIDVVCDAAAGCSATHRAYGKTATDNVGLGVGIGTGIGGALGIGAGLAASLGGGLAPGLGLLIGLGVTVLGTIAGLIAGIATSSGASVHVCPNWAALPPPARAESILAAVYEAFASLNPEQSRTHAALAHALHDSAIGPPPPLSGRTP